MFRNCLVKQKAAKMGLELHFFFNLLLEFYLVVTKSARVCILKGGGGAWKGSQKSKLSSSYLKCQANFILYLNLSKKVK